MSRTSTPETEIGENAPACAPLIVMMPITSGLIRVRAAKDIAAGEIKATAAGLNVPRAVSTEAQKKNTHGTIVTRPRTPRIQALTRRSIVPFFFAIPKK